MILPVYQYLIAAVVALLVALLVALVIVVVIVAIVNGLTAQPAPVTHFQLKTV